MQYIMVLDVSLSTESGILAGQGMHVNVRI